MVWAELAANMNMGCLGRLFWGHSSHLLNIGCQSSKPRLISSKASSKEAATEGKVQQVAQTAFSWPIREVSGRRRPALAYEFSPAAGLQLARIVGGLHRPREDGVLLRILAALYQDQQ